MIGIDGPAASNECIDDENIDNGNIENQISKTQEVIEEIADAMRENLDKVLERQTKLSDVCGRAQVLEESSKQFQKTSREVKKVERRKAWWYTWKLWICVVVVVVVVVIAIVLGCVL